MSIIGGLRHIHSDNPEEKGLFILNHLFEVIEKHIINNLNLILEYQSVSFIHHQDPISL